MTEETTVQQEAEVKDEFTILMEKLEQGDYMKQGYTADSQITISGELFQNFVNINAMNQKVMAGYKETLTLVNESMGQLLDSQYNLTINLMQQHIRNVDSGLTISNRELDKLDAKQKIKPIKKDAKK